MPIQSQNPATGEVLKTFEEISDAELSRKLALSKSAFEKWRRLPIQERGRLVMKLSEYLLAHKREMGMLAVLEMGKTIKAAEIEIEKCALNCEYYCENAEKFLADEHIATKASQSYVTFEPLGAVFAVMPWNFPFWQVYRFAAPALMAGNVALLKHASNVPQCALAIEKSFIECGFPEGVFQSLLVTSKRVPRIISDPAVAAVALTGSEKAGSEVAKVAAENIKKSVLELGGSDPFIVFEDADLALACDLAADSRISSNAGQVCNAAKRFIVNENIAEKFASDLAEKFKKLKVGSPTDPETDIGPLSLKNILDEVARQVKQSVELGAKIVIGGKQPEMPGYFYEPTVLTGVKKGMPVYDEEVFGPVAPIITFKEEPEAIAIANDTEYGLGAAIITQNVQRAKELAKEIQAGNVFINERVRSDPRLPFGGIKKSGFGRELSHYGIKEFTNIKTILVK